MASRVLTAVVAAVLLAAADWPTFRGDPAQTGVSTEALPDKLVQRWTYATVQDRAGGGVEGTAAIVDGVVYVGAFDEHLHAIDLATGQAKWKFKAGAIKSPVGVHDGRVYVGNVEGVFYCLDIAGKEKWKFDVGAEITSGSNFGDGTVLFGSQDETLYCLNRADGKPK